MNHSPALTPAQIAKAALRRLALAKQEPTPENYAQAWADEAGAGGSTAASSLPTRAKPVLERLVQRMVEDPAQRTELLQSLLQGHWDQAHRQVDRASESLSAQSQAWAQLIDRLTRGLERSGKQWTLARKKDSLQRVLDSSRSDMQRLQHRLKQLVGSWDSDTELAPSVEPGAAAAPADGNLAAAAVASPMELAAPRESAGSGQSASHTHWSAVFAPLESTVRAALPPDAQRAVALADELAALATQIGGQGATAALAEQVAEVCGRARRFLAHRHHLLGQVHQLSRDLADGLADVAEEDSWVRGQLDALSGHLAESPNPRSVQTAASLLADTRERQRSLRVEREQARQALKALIQQMLSELGELDEHTGRFSEGMLRFADTIEGADSLESLAGVVREMVAESRNVQALVHATRERLHGEHGRAAALETQVRELESELRRLSDEVATDALTQVANRRGLSQLFAAEQARLARDGSELAIGLLDIDNFKRLNDSLGHTVGDEALVALANHVRTSLRPVDVVARFGGEEFVVLLPGTPVEEGQTVLTRLQRQLSASLFMHEDKEVFVTFSAGVTRYRPGESLEEALERSDEALYEAKRAGKNRTCIG